MTILILFLPSIVALLAMAALIMAQTLSPRLKEDKEETTL